MKNLRLESLVLGPVQTNCYFAMNRETKELFLVDPADHAERIIERIDMLQACPKAILLTHGHFDHIGAVRAVADHYGIPVFIEKEEAPLLEDASLNASLLMMGKAQSVRADRLLSDGETLQIAGFTVQVLHTPGHTAGGACFYLPEEEVLFSGDTLFCGSVGRTDLPTGSMRELRKSLHEVLFRLPDTTMVFPGHGESTDIAFEKKYNPY